MELSQSDSFVVRTAHVCGGVMLEVEAWEKEKAGAVARRCAGGRPWAWWCAPVPTPRGSWVALGVVECPEDSACLLHGLEVREEKSGPPLAPL